MIPKKIFPLIPPEIYGEIIKFAVATAANYYSFQFVNREWLNAVRWLYPYPKETFAIMENVWYNSQKMWNVTNNCGWYCSYILSPVLPDGNKHGIGIRVDEYAEEYYMFKDDILVFAITLGDENSAVKIYANPSRICIDNQINIIVDDDLKNNIDKVIAHKADIAKTGAALGMLQGFL